MGSFSETLSLNLKDKQYTIYRLPKVILFSQIHGQPSLIIGKSFPSPQPLAGHFLLFSSENCKYPTVELVDLKGKWGLEGNWLKRDHAQSFCCWPLKKWEESWSQNVSCKCFWHRYWPGGRVLGLILAGCVPLASQSP